MSLFYKYAGLTTILLLAFIDYMSLGLVYPMFSAMIFSKDGSLLSPQATQAVRGLWLGIILALMPLAQFFSGPLLGTLSDRWGRKMVIILSIPFGMFGYFVALSGVWMNSIFLLALSRIMIGVAAGNEAVGNAAIADLSSSREKAKFFGLMGMAGGFGFTVGPFLGGKLSAVNMWLFSGYEVPFVFAGFLCLVNLLLVVFLFKESYQPVQRRMHFSFGFTNVGNVWKVPGFLILLGIVFFYNFGYSFYWEFIPTFWISTYNFDVEMVGNRLAFGAAIYALSAGLLTRFLASRLTTEAILFYAFVWGAIALGLPLLISHPWLFWLYIPLQEGVIALIYPASSALISNKCSGDVQGEVMGVLQAVRSFALILSPLIAGASLGITVKMPMVVGACTFCLAAYTLRPLRKGM